MHILYGVGSNEKKKGGDNSSGPSGAKPAEIKTKMIFFFTPRATVWH